MIGTGCTPDSALLAIPDYGRIPSQHFDNMAIDVQRDASRWIASSLRAGPVPPRDSSPTEQ
jgi:hypothetical protein